LKGKNVPQCLYNEEPLQDVIHILQFINDYTKGLEISPVDIDTRIVESIVTSCTHDFPHNDGIDKASAFKKVANFLCCFIGERPIQDPFPGDHFKDLSSIKNYQNAVIGFELAKMALHKSTIMRKDGKFVIQNPIQVSKHSYIDIIDSLANVSQSTHFKIVSVLLEQLVYKTNPNCQYPDVF